MGKIALVCTSAREMRGHPTGAWLEEIATPYYAIRDAGLDCAIVSIDGGEVPIDGASASGDFFTEDCKKFTADAEAQGAMKASASFERCASSRCSLEISSLARSASRWAKITYSDARRVENFVRPQYVNSTSVPSSSVFPLYASRRRQRSFGLIGFHSRILDNIPHLAPGSRRL